MMDSITRTEQMLWMRTLVRTGSAPDGFKEFVEGMEGEQFFARFPFLKMFEGDDNFPDPEDVLEAFCQDDPKLGFLIQAARPVVSKGGLYSWGHYHTAWLYADTFEQIEPVLDAWAAAMEEKDRARTTPVPNIGESNETF